jgi:hypothetical protein
LFINFLSLHFIFIKHFYHLLSNALTNIDFRLIKSNNHDSRVHTFGIGSGASKKFVIGAAECGKGSYSMIPDNDPSINAKVIKALKLASRPLFDQMEVDWNNNQDAIKFLSPSKEYQGCFYEEEPIEICALLDKEKLIKDTLKLSFHDTLYHKETEYSFEIDPEAITVTENDNSFKARIQTYITEQEALEDKGLEIDKTILKERSIKYSVLCKETSFFGKVKNKNKVTTEQQMKFMEIKPGKLQILNKMLYWWKISTNFSLNF